jgi:peptidoglycan/xylan/chitin deacetylase (PgdA/CDA1 family)
MGRIARSLYLACGLTGLVAAAGLPVASPIFSPGRALLRIDDRLADQTAVALTFDDGPHPQGTPAALEMLERYRVRATFFLVGEQVRRRPALAAEIAARGHRIGIHGDTHRVAAWLTPRAFSDELDRAASAIAHAVGYVPDLYRPPRGVFTYGALAEVRRRGWCPVLWAADGRDWRSTATPESISLRIPPRLRGGEVVLLHDSDFYSSPGAWRCTVAALPPLLAAMEAKRLLPVPLTRNSLAQQEMLEWGILSPDKE